MFAEENNPEKRTLIFIAAFHLGVPLAICRTKKSTGWEEIRQELTDQFSSHPQQFEVISDNFEPETKFPLGRPLFIRHNNFFKLFDMSKLLSKVGYLLPNQNYVLDNMIWVCPSGIVLITAKMGFVEDQSATSLGDTANDRKSNSLVTSPSPKNASDISLTDYENKVIVDHYAELGYIFADFAETILSIIPSEFLSSSLCCATDIEKCQRLINWRQKLNNDGPDTHSKLVQILHDNPELYSLCEEILVDIYYIEHNCDNADSEDLKIGYVDTSIKSFDRSLPDYVFIGFSTFIGLLWIIKQLGELSRIVNDCISGYTSLQIQFTFELKQFRIFCLQFINESSPIQIRLTRCYMEVLETFWRESRLQLLVEQINEQLTTLDTMSAWFDDIKKEIRNLKIGIAAILLAIISVAAVAAQLISTIDVNSQLGIRERSALILIGLIIGILCTIGVYTIPFTRWFTLTKKVRQIPKNQAVN